MQRMTRAIAILAMVIGVASAAFAQATTTGSIQVFVTDQNGEKVPGVTVSATAPDVTTLREVVTDADGLATLEAMQPSLLYTVKITMTGFKEQIRENVQVRVAQVVTIRTALSLTGVQEQVTVQVEMPPLVDVTSATTGQDITLRLTESLPTGRSYQSYLQLVPGVLPDDPQQSGNPASRSGINYSDIGGNLGVSSDNYYYMDGINVTDPVTGTFGANMNTEVIQEQKVITGGVPAEFPGAPGLLSQVVTKSGGNRFSGSANYFFQNSSLVAENQHSVGEEFSTNETAFTIGGPALVNKAWFFGSYRFFNRNDDVTLLDTNEFMRSVENRQHQGFAKGTVGPTPNDSFSFTFLNDPTDISGRRERQIPNAQDRSRIQGGDRYSGNYTRLWGAALIEGGAFKHNGEVTDTSATRRTNNAILYRNTDTRTINDEFLGGWGIDTINQRDMLGVRGSAQFSWRGHTFKGGLEWQQNENFRDTLYIDGSAIFDSISLINRNVTAGDIAGQQGQLWNRRAFSPGATSDFSGLITTINGRPDRARFYDAFDGNRDGTITPTELGSTLRFNSTAGNPDGAVNYDRTFQSSLGPQTTNSEGLQFYVEDTWRLNRFTFNLGLRSERWEHFATTGDNIFTFDWTWAPRLSAVYDLLGDGKQKVSAYYGRYYDPIRNNMTNFAGTLTGSVIEEQVNIFDEWVTYRTRGGPIVQDAFFSPTTKTPYTDETQIGYEIDLGHNMSVAATYYNRRTRDILEDYDLGLYAFATDGTTSYPGPINAPNSMWLGLDYFGYDENPGSNFVIGTLEGGKRDANGFELQFRKRFDNNWQFQSSYNYLDADGNTNSDSNADYQGDIIELDPRAPNQFGAQPGTIAHLFKAAGSYTFNFGLELGASVQANSGSLSSITYSNGGRNLPLLGDAFEFAGITSQQWIQEGAVGGVQNEAWGQLDLRVKYMRNVRAATAEVFLDLFNVTDNQVAVRNQDLLAGQGGVAFGEGLTFNTPRRAFVGVRVRF